MLKLHAKWSALTATLIFLSLLYFSFKYFPGNILSWDVFGYYLYLPFTFVYRDLGLHHRDVLQHIVEQYHNTATIYQTFEGPIGNWIMKYPMGLAILNIPFFLLGHLYAILFKYPSDGFSVPYQVSILIGCLFYTLAGIYLLRKVLLAFFNDAISAIVLGLIMLGTNYFFHVSFYGNGGMSHNYLFTLYALLLWLTIRWHETFSPKHSIALGLTIGLMTLCRPTEIVAILIPALWNVWNKKSFLEKLNRLSDNRLQVLLVGIMIFTALLPQFIYWKVYSGKFLFYSYANNPGEGFEFLNPFINEVLFSFRKGWLIYTPLMTMAILGFFVLYRNSKVAFLSLFLFFILNLYITSSWSCWWYAECFSQRALISSYPVMAIPLGFLIQYVTLQKKTVQFLLGIIFTFIVALNLFQTWQFIHGIIHPSRMTKGYYFASFGKTKINPEWENLLLVNRSFDGIESFTNEGIFTEKNIGLLDFENEGTNNNIKDSIVHRGRFSFHLDSTIEFSPAFQIPYKDITQKPYAWIRASVYIYPTASLKESPSSFVITFDHKGNGYKYKTVDLKNANLLPGIWNKISLDYLTPEIRNANDKLKVYIWNSGKENVFIDDMRIDVFEPKK